MSGYHMGSIVELMLKSDSFHTLVAAIEAADLVETLSNGGPFTIFAPADEAFAKLPEGTIRSLLEDPSALREGLTSHVALGKHMAADVAGMVSLRTLQGQEVAIDTEDGVRIKGAKIVHPDIEADNGVIHVIDTVILPE